MNNGSFLLPVRTSSIHYTVSGTGAPLLIAPVSWGVDGHRWTTLDVLAERFTLIRLDPRGTGGSGDVTEKSEYGIPTLVEDIEALRSHLGIDRWSIMGQSAGGWTALEYTLAHMARAAKLVVVCSAPTGRFQKGTFRDPAHPLYPRYERLSQEIRSLPHDERVRQFNRAIYQYDVQTEGARAAIDRIFAATPFNAKRNQYFISQELQRYDVRDRLRDIAVPSLIIGGAHDVHVSPEWSVTMAERIPGARLEMMQGSGHFPWLDEPEAFFRTVADFLLH
ncbi:MAG: alpha/beta hydrolase [Bacteroidetes bacterium]|nr:MAG: alpha/beta hydrolase [Bacteroidota bacterium]